MDPETGEVTFLPPQGASGAAPGSPDESTPGLSDGDSRQSTELTAKRKRERRAKLNQMRRVAQKVTAIDRKKGCGVIPVEAGDGRLRFDRNESTGRTSVHGVAECGYASCPTCATKKAAQKAEEEELLTQDCLDRGGSVLPLVLTFPHDFGMAYKPMLDSAKKVWSHITGHRRWKEEARDAYGIEWTSGWDATHGGNGWHPHLHVNLRLDRDLTDEELEQLHLLIFDLWSARMQRSGYRPPALENCPLERMRDGEKASKYVIKLGVAMEVASPTTKKAKTGHRSPWQILADVGQRSRPRDIALWREWEEGVFRKEMVGRCRKSKARLKAIKQAEKDQEHLEEVVEEVTTIAVLRRKTWAKIKSVWGIKSRLLEAAERAGRDGIREELARFDWPEGFDPLLPIFDWSDYEGCRGPPGDPGG